MDGEQILDTIQVSLFPAVIGILWYLYKRDVRRSEEQRKDELIDNKESFKGVDKFIEHQVETNSYLKENLAELKIITKYHERDIKELKEKKP